MLDTVEGNLYDSVLSSRIHSSVELIDSTLERLELIESLLLELDVLITSIEYDLLFEYAGEFFHMVDSFNLFK